MEGIGSCLNWRKGSKVAKCSNGGVDRISALPDKVLAHMLSFLPTKNSVGTSVLSHRWRYLFTFVSKFDFDETVFFNQKNDPNNVLYKERFACRRAGVKCPSIFKDFVDRVLLVCNSPHISSFRLNCGLGFDCSNVDVWIRFALLRGVTEVDIFTYEDDCFLPPSLFSCETLVVLKLRGYFEMKFPASFKLPKLKALQLSTVEFDDGNSLNRLLSGCPLLEDLELLGGGWEKVEDINISSPSMRRLTIAFSVVHSSTLLQRSSISLDLPDLLYFSYVDYVAIHYYLKNLNCVEEARFDFLFDAENHFHFEKNRTAFWEIANGFSGAKVLFFGGLSIEAMLGGQTKLPTFNNLTRLELGCARYILWRFTLPNLLNSTPNLETLVFSQGLLERKPDEDMEDKTFWSKQRKAPPCVSRIKLIEITSFLGFDEELQITKYFLRHGKGLRKLVLDWMMRTKEHWKDFNKLKKLADSKGCMITGLKLWPGGYGLFSSLPLALHEDGSKTLQLSVKVGVLQKVVLKLPSGQFDEFPLLGLLLLLRSFLPALFCFRKQTLHWPVNPSGTKINFERSCKL